ncbi:MAG: Mfa1 family fimbria major subunit [Tannerella sp.]|jgi:hypothetical protein|nr:Mfa1 family fimbria major subunit [Tannerella sp.]
MKRMFKFFVYAAFLAVGITGCVSDGEGPAPNPGGEVDPTKVVEGIPTYATFSFTVSEGDNSGTRALTADGGENANLTEIRLIIFKGTGVNDTCEVNQSVDLTYTGTTGTPNVNIAKSKTVKVTSGQKRILVIANAKLNTTLSAAVDEATGIIPRTTTFAQFATKIYDLEGTNGSMLSALPTAAPANINALTTLVSSGGYIMSNAIDGYSIKTLYANVDSTTSNTGTPSALTDPNSTSNTLQIAIQRAVAKARIMYNATAAATPVALSSPKTADSTGFIDANTLKYTLLAVNRSLYLFQRFVSDNVLTTPGASTGLPLSNYPVSPYYDKLSTSSAQTEFDKYFYNFSPIADWVTLSANATGVVSHYLTENTHDVHMKGNASDFAIQGEFRVDTGYILINGAFAQPAGTPTDSIRFSPLTRTFTVPDAFWYRGASAPYVVPAGTAAPHYGKLYQLRGVAGANGLSDRIFFTDRLTAYKVAYILNNGQGGAAGFDEANYKRFPGIPADSLKYDLQKNSDPSRALIAEYDHGTCYYAVRLEDPTAAAPNKTGVKRNHAYTANITQFKGIGAPDLDDLNFPPTDITEAGETYITASITIDPWRVVTWTVQPGE